MVLLSPRPNGNSVGSAVSAGLTCETNTQAQAEIIRIQDICINSPHLGAYAFSACNAV